LYNPVEEPREVVGNNHAPGNLASGNPVIDNPVHDQRLTSTGQRENNQVLSTVACTALMIVGAYGAYRYNPNKYHAWYQKLCTQYHVIMAKIKAYAKQANHCTKNIAKKVMKHGFQAAHGEPPSLKLRRPWVRDRRSSLEPCAGKITRA